AGDATSKWRHPASTTVGSGGVELVDQTLERTRDQDLRVVHPHGVHATLTSRATRGRVQNGRNHLDGHADAVHDEELLEVTVDHDGLVAATVAVTREGVGQLGHAGRPVGRGVQQAAGVAVGEVLGPQVVHRPGGAVGRELTDLVVDRLVGEV